MDLFSLDGKIAMVSGGNSGIGMAIAIGLAKAGADLFIPVYHLHEDEAVIAAIEALGRKVVLVEVDLAQEEVACSIAQQCVAQMGGLDIVVNNAGTIRRAPLLDGANRDWQAVIDINLNAVYYISREAAKFMVQQGSGKIINLCSMLSFQGGIFVPSYTASKHAVAGLTKSFANELAKHNIQVNAIAPGYVETNNTAPILADNERKESISARIPAGRWAQPEDLVGSAVFLASHASNYVNGHILAVDGGWLVR